jgi:formylglycine-generating enzyme required for sulfatase activity
LRLALLVFSVALALNSTSAEERRPQRWALLVGVNDYANLRDLRYANRDMQALATSLISHGFAEDHVFTIHDDAKDLSFKPFKVNIERQLRLLTRLADGSDALLIGFSGHGMLLGSKSYLCPFEARTDDPAGTMIATDEMAAQVAKFSTQCRLMIVDACRNDPRTARHWTGASPGHHTTKLNRLFEAAPRGFAVLSSCGPGETSYEEDRFQHGVFMNYVLQGLRGEADGNEDGDVSLGELHSFVSVQTKAHVARTWNDFQSPQLLGHLDGTYWDRQAIAPAATDRSTAQSMRDLPAPPGTALPSNRTRFVTKNIGMEFMLIPPGEFVMGSPAAEMNHTADEHEHVVRITHPFYLGRYEVTQAEYVSVMGRNPSWFNASRIDDSQAAGRDTTRFPVDRISWDDAHEFCRRLSAIEGRTFRLPTEAEWEYACRAGTRTAYYTGGSEPDLSKAGWYGANLTPAGNTKKRTNRVGQREPNAFGLFDMHGNVWEWCADWYDTDYYAGSPAIDPVGPPSGVARVIRGGGWCRGPRLCRSAYRGKMIPTDRNNLSGFRVCSSTAAASPAPPARPAEYQIP